MKTKIIILLMVAALNTSLSAQHNFSVEVINLEPGKGYVYFGLYNKEKGFLDEQSQFAAVKVKADGNKAAYTFKDLPNGDYAVAVYQDANSNGKCDRNLIGYPSEGFGFSKNYRPKFSAPDFSAVKIAIYQSAKTSITLIGKR